MFKKFFKWIKSVFSNIKDNFSDKIEFTKEIIRFIATPEVISCTITFVAAVIAKLSPILPGYKYIIYLIHYVNMYNNIVQSIIKTWR